MKKMIAIVDDEPDIVELLNLHLIKAGYDTKAFFDGESFFNYLEKKTPDLVLLDLMLPDMDGMDICKDLRKNEKFVNLPIIMLTAKSQELDKILGLEFGADDYVTKPFSSREIVARVKAVLRRAASESKKVVSSHRHIDEDLIIDVDKFEVLLESKPINLTPTEFKILDILSEKPGWVFTREKLLDILWGNEKIVVDRTIDVHIRHLREKLGDKGKIIKSIKGVGYKIQT